MNGRQQAIWARRENSSAASVEPGARLTIPHLLGVIAGDLRYELLCVLAHGPRTVKELAQLLERSVPHVSENLGLLFRHGLVVFRPVKRQHFYELSALVKTRATHEIIISLEIASGSGSSIVVPVVMRIAGRRIGLLQIVEPAPNVTSDRDRASSKSKGRVVRRAR